MLLEVNEHVIDWLPAYVLDALTDDETSRVAEHLAGCQSCQVEYHHLQQVAEELPLALVQTSPPTRVKDKLMSSIHARQVSAVASSPLSFWQKLSARVPARLPALGAALIIVLLLSNVLLWRNLTQVNQVARTQMTVVSLVSTQYSPAAIGTLIMDPSGKYGSLVVDNLANLDPAKQYQVWLIHGDTHTSGGVFTVNPDGYASLEIKSTLPLNSYDSIGVSVEPAGGSLAPTGEKVLGGDLPK